VKYVGPLIATGSGFFVRENIIATNFHVIDGADDAAIKLENSDTLYSTAGVIAVDKQNDLVLLQINNIRGKPLRLSVSEPLEVGLEIYAVGSPKGLEGTIASGIVSRLGTRAEGEGRIQITAPISPGSSGGPVVNKYGAVIGIAQASIREGQNLNFAIPVQYLARMLTNLSVPEPIRNIASRPSQTDASLSTSMPRPESLPTICERSISSIRTPYETGNHSAREFAVVGNRYDDEGKYEEAVIALIKATQLNPKYHQAYFYLWRAYSHLGCIENQIIALKQAVIIKPNDAHYVSALATTLNLNGWSEEALEVYKEAIRVDPKSSMSYAGLGYT
jgi:tetratricopeptide (TPR) repeat protein